MEILFANKSLLPSAYKKLFMERLTNMDKLKESIKCRYGKKEINEETFNTLFRLNHKSLFDFVGAAEEARLRIFFGSRENVDQRDTQITLLDRFILDAIQFDVHQTLLTQFLDEYKINKDQIEKEWHDLIENHKSDLELPLDFLIQRQIEATKHVVFEELQFPKNLRLRLFSLEKNNLKLNEQVFSKWLTTEKSESNLLRNLIITGSGILLLSLLCLPLFFLGASTGLVIASVSATAKLVLSCTLSVGVISTAGLYILQYLTNNQKLKETRQNTNLRFSHAYLVTSFYVPDKEELNSDHDISPFHSKKWMLEKHKPGNVIDYNEEESSYLCTKI